MRLLLRLLVLAAAVLTANVQLTGQIDPAKNSLSQAGKQTSPAPPATPQPPNSRRPSTPDSAKPAPEKEEIIPNIAVNPEVIQKQQAEIRQECEAVAGRRPDINCDCVVNSYPQLRLEAISKYTRDVERGRALVCSSDPARCSAETELLDWITNPETQANFPTYVNRPKTRSAAYLPGQMRHFTQGLQLYGSKCQDRSVLGSAAQKQCQDVTSSGLIRLQPGKSSKEYCDCVNQKVTEGASDSQAMIDCRKQ